ncbi:hypothetical protein ACIPQJ_23380 [Streptomyces sp. NPDC090082]|uniref:hypothetical protein n=1 Tax=unclassified Streptomyces TaxID=2593676 RepID=UPI0038188576
MTTGTLAPSAATFLDDVLNRRATPCGHDVDWSDLGIRDEGDLLAALPPLLPFETSGSTGGPVIRWRTRERLVQEARHVADLLAVDPPDVFVVHAPPRDLHGLLFGCLAPALLGRRARYARPDDPLPRVARRPLFVAVPSTWSHLRRSLREVRGYERITVTHGTGALPEAAPAVRRAVPRLSLLDVHGSTETGLIGTRADGRWDFTLAPDLAFASHGSAAQAASPSPVPLVVRSTRIPAGGDGPQSPEHVLAVLVTPTGPRTYRLAGRYGDPVTSRGQWAGLAGIEAVLRGAVPGVGLRCVPVPDPLRGEGYEVVVAGAEHDRRAVVAASLRALPAWQAPRVVRLDAPGGAVPAHLPSADENDS